MRSSTPTPTPAPPDTHTHPDTPTSIKNVLELAIIKLELWLKKYYF